MQEMDSRNQNFLEGGTCPQPPLDGAFGTRRAYGMLSTPLQTSGSAPAAHVTQPSFVHKRN